MGFFGGTSTRQKLESLLEHPGKFVIFEEHELNSHHFHFLNISLHL